MLLVTGLWLRLFAPHDELKVAHCWFVKYSFLLLASDSSFFYSRQFVPVVLFLFFTLFWTMLQSSKHRFDQYFLLEYK